MLYSSQTHKQVGIKFAFTWLFTSTTHVKYYFFAISQ
jgi:hypothetical protein